MLPQKNLHLSILDSNQKCQLKPMLPTPTKPLLEMSIGLPKVWFKKLKIKDNVDLAGLSPPLPPLNLLPVLSLELLEISLNKNSFHVVPFPIYHAHVWDVTEETWVKD